MTTTPAFFLYTGKHHQQSVRGERVLHVREYKTLESTGTPKQNEKLAVELAVEQASKPTRRTAVELVVMLSHSFSEAI